MNDTVSNINNRKCFKCGKTKHVSSYQLHDTFCDRCYYRSTPKDRVCLKCDKPFLSLNEMRLCDHCKKLMYSNNPRKYNKE